MNKWEEALQVIRSEIDDSYETQGEIPYRAMHACNVVEELVKRATPMKPIEHKFKIWEHPITGGEYREGHPFFDEATAYDVVGYYCPNCKVFFGRSELDFLYFCEHCSQAIDRSDINE